MSRALWFVAGAGVGVYGMVRGRRVAEAFTPDGLRDRANGLQLGLRLVRDEVATASAEKEIELRAKYGLAKVETGSTSELTQIERGST